MCFRTFKLCLLCSFWAFIPQLGVAGLTSSEVVLVVNGASASSRTVANHFVALRNIPARNVIVLSQVPDSEVIGVEDFRTKILRPVLTEIGRRKLGGHVQCVTYSSDFPTAVDITADLAKIENLPNIYTKKGSINGLTFLYSRVLNSDPSYIGGVVGGLAGDQHSALSSNYYARDKLDSYFQNPGGVGTQEKWTAIQKQISSGEHAQASLAIEALLKEHPHQFPLAYLAAAEAAQAGDAERANKFLELAIAKGWNAGGFLKNDKRFDSLRDNNDFQVLEFLVDSDVFEYKTGVGFDARTSWTPNGVAVAGANGPKFGFRYLLSTMLGVTRGKGNSLEEVLNYLNTSATADFSHPDGGFYFCLTSDVRTTTRQWAFLQATKRLKEMGYEAEIVTEVLPTNKERVLGAQTGSASYNWASSGSQFVAGAIADNLTSYGTVMNSASQTKLTEFLKYGAAGSSGTVTEPYAIQEKFPLSQMYAHYANGASLAEAFYLSVSGPYQLLILGDPLCRPFSNAPLQDFGQNVRNLPLNGTISLQLDLTGPNYANWADDERPQKLRTEAFAPDAISVLFDGQNPVSRPVRPNVNLKLSNQPAGYHELILRFASSDPLRQKNESVIPIWLGPNDVASLSLKGNSDTGTRNAPLTAKKDSVLEFSAKAKNAKRLTLVHDWEQLATQQGNQHTFNISTDQLGLGPCRIQLRAETEDGVNIFSLPVWISIEE